MNRSFFVASGILIGLLLAGALIYTNTPQTTFKKMEVIPEQNRISTDAPEEKIKTVSRRAKDTVPEPNRISPPPRPEALAVPMPFQEEEIDNVQIPNVHLVVQGHARWGQVLQHLNDTDEPVTGALRTRIQEMRREMMEMRRNPESIDLQHLVEQQRMILSELRQIPAWGPELKKTAARVESVLNEVGTQ